MSTFPDDKELMVQFRETSSRDRAFTTIVKKYQEKIYWHIRRLVVEHDDADDVMQNVFMKVWTHLDNFRETSSLFTWIYKIATNECLTFLEQQKRKFSASLSDHESILANKVKAERDFDGKQLEWKLQVAIQQLPEKQRVVFSLRYFDEMTYPEMSRVLDTSEGSLKASYHHAVKKVEEFILNN